MFFYRCGLALLGDLGLLPAKGFLFDYFMYSLYALMFAGVRRLICIEAGSGQVEGIITLRDVFQFLL